MGGRHEKERSGGVKGTGTQTSPPRKRTILLILAQAWSPARVAAERLLADDILACLCRERGRGWQQRERSCSVHVLFCLASLVDPGALCQPNQSHSPNYPPAATLCGCRLCVCMHVGHSTIEQNHATRWSLSAIIALAKKPPWWANSTDFGVLWVPLSRHPV